ncbi:uncharacterized protein YlaI [Gracilibacillus halotolerans]|uniref:Uncharacterized protein YlaI n=1 Tax=Gracilibacillus halotolerans TaxID=74386 RepID=A0A841RHJ1_9BACI|nr:YlaI family protein [Gracilibacillus halotolerans]MBB6511317.1 uncharacterized protein YlaI [Gracilibacillus halotolerans]
MRVKCVICDNIENIDNGSPVAKKLRNRLNSTFMCEDCSERIKENTLKRHKNENFQLYQSKEDTDQYLS